MYKILNIGIGLAIALSLSACEKNVEVIYHKNGQIASKFQLNGGVRNGEALKYYQNGRIKWKAIYHNGSLNGKAIKYDSTGKVLTKFEYVDNIMQGPFLAYFPNGKIKEKGNLRQGRRDGMCFSFYENGSIFRKSYCVQDTVIYGKTFSEEGKLIASNLPIEITPYDEINSVEIELTYSEFEGASIFLGFGNIDSEGNLLDTLGYADAKSMKYLYKLDSNQSRLSGVLFEVKNPEGTFEARYHFSYEKETK
ncbi:MAG: hypothetical protein ABJF11_03320 [Reichenbachiella sp.]|uniref:toxin-antitoxin system YwqK family antitoxin n=1 Tax=Reichenbachiella sp. TaxID=2184521 RepID=UPI003263DD3F